MGPRVDGAGSPIIATVPAYETAVPEKTPESAKPAEPPPAPAKEKAATDGSSQVAEHSLAGQMQAAHLHSQVIKNPAKISQPAKNPDGPKNAAPAKNMQTILTDSGMKGVHNPPTDSELKTYYATKAPAKDLIAKREYGTAAAEYRKLAAAETNPVEKQRLSKVADQLDVAQSMNQAKVGDLSFPPTQKNLESYFRTMKGKPIAEIRNAYEKYADAFYVHSELPGVDKGDIKYSKNTYDRSGKRYESTAPQNWGEISDKRDMHSDGRRIIDCEGYALIGQKCFAAAGFNPVQFSVMSRKDKPNTAENESFTMQHIMVTGSRTIVEGGVKKTEVAVISNGTFSSQSAEPDKKFNFANFQSGVLVDAYGDTFREIDGRKATVPGGLLVIRNDNVTAEFDLLQILKSSNRPIPK